MCSVGVSRAYLDSKYLLALIRKEDGAREVENMLYKLRDNAFDVFVPFIVLGEICGVVFRKSESDQDKRDEMVKLVNIMADNGIKWENMKPTKSDAFDIMVTLSNKDELLNPTDVMILSHVLSDPDSKFFFTTDSNMLENAVITDVEKDLRNDERRHTALKISDGF